MHPRLVVSAARIDQLKQKKVYSPLSLSFSLINKPHVCVCVPMCSKVANPHNVNFTNRALSAGMIQHADGAMMDRTLDWASAS